MAASGINPLTGKPYTAADQTGSSAPSGAGNTQGGTWQPPDEDLNSWASVSSDIGGQLQNLGMSPQDAYNSWVAAGRPRGAAARSWKASLQSPQNELKDLPPVSPNGQMVEEVRQQAGLNHGTGANDVATTSQPDPVQQALEALRGAGAASAQQQQQALGQAQVAGDQNAAQQQDLITMLRQAASGGGPSAAEALFQLALGKNIAAQQGAAAGVRGGNAAAAARNAGIAGSQMMDQSRNTAAALRAGEQATAQQTLGSVLGQARAGDIQKAATVADIASQVRGQDVGQAAQVAGLTQAAAALDQAKQQAAAGTALSLLQLDTGAQQQTIADLLAKAGLDANYTLGSQGLELQRDQIRAQKEAADRQFLMQLMGTIFNTAGTATAAAV